MKKQLAILGASFGLPVLAFAQTINSAQSLAQWVITFINTILVPLVFAVAFIIFIIGVVQVFIAGKGDAEAMSAGRTKVILGIVGFFLMVVVWGLVNILLGTFNLQNYTPNEPQAPYSAQ